MNLDIPNTYINDAFLMIYLSIFVFITVAIMFDVVFPLLGTAKDLIRDFKTM